MDAGARSDDSLDQLLTELQDMAAGSARQAGCDWDATFTWRERAVSMSPAVTRALAEAAGHQDADGIAVTSWQATTPRSWRPPACPPECSSSAQGGLG